MKTFAVLILSALSCCAATNNIVDPAGHEWTVGSDGWYYWAGVFTAFGFMLFAMIKRMATRVVGSGSDF